MSTYSYAEIIIGRMFDEIEFDVQKQITIWNGHILPEEEMDYYRGVPLDTKDFKPFVAVHTVCLTGGAVAEEALIGIKVKSTYPQDIPYFMEMGSSFIFEILDRLPVIMQQVSERLAELGLPNDNVKLYLVGNYTT